MFSWLEAIRTLGDSDHPIKTEAYQRLGEVSLYNGEMDKAMNYISLGLESAEQVARHNRLYSKGIRFLQTRTGTLTQLGQLANEIEYFVKSGELKARPQMHGVLLAPNGAVANRAILEYLRAHVCVITDQFLCDRLSVAANELEWNTFYFRMSDDRIEWQWSGMVSLQRRWEAQGRSPILTLRDQDRERGWQALESIGIDRSAWFVTLHVRRPAIEVHNSGTGIRNAQIASYSEAIKLITSRGGWVIRMGDPGMPPLPQMDRTIDYAHSSLKSDWMDLFLCAESRFYVGTSSGLNSFPMLFGVPIVMTNVCPTNGFPLSEKDIFIPKLFRHRESGQLLSFRKALKPPFRNCYNSRVIEPLGYEVIDNSPQELRDVVAEMLQRVESSSYYSKEDQELQEIAQAIVKEHDIDGMQSRFGREFLQQYRSLLDEMGSPAYTAPKCPETATAYFLL
jgi:putative glycosyltransferase (TIGR04372 family)